MAFLDEGEERGFWLRATDRFVVVFARLFLWLSMRLPYERRVPVAGWVFSRIIAPVAGYRARVRDNLAKVRPDLDQAEVRRLMRAVPDNVGRTLVEIWSGQEFIDRVRGLPLTGPGVPALELALAEGRPAVLATGHVGNYDAVRARLIATGYRVGALYKPMKNDGFNEIYVRAISQIGTPLFARGTHGLGEMVRHLKSGGMLGLLMDQHIGSGVMLTFFGAPAMTATSAADLALKYKADLIPIYALREPNGLDFRIVVEAPIAPDTPEAMTQAVNDSLETLVRAHMDQWFWIHRRWKVRKRRKPKPEGRGKGRARR